jgi:hypothetical protein
MIRLLKYSLIATALGAWSLIAAEAFVRAFAPQSFVPREVAAAPYGVRMNKPGAVYAQRTPETTALVRINRQGLRADRDFAQEKPRAIRRLLMFGDSYFLGYEASIEDIAATRLEAELREARCPVDVLNFAVSGFGTAEMLRTLEAKGNRFRPDVVIFQWHHTDPDDNRRAHLYELADGELRETGDRYTPAMGARSALERNAVYRAIASRSHLFIALRERGSRYVRRVMAGHVFSRKTTTEGAEEVAAGAIDVAILDRADAVARAAGAQFYVVDVPSAQSRTRFRPGFRLLPPDVAARPNFISTAPAFEAAASNAEKLFWEKGHRHLTPKGNAVIARAMADRLLADSEARAALDCAGERDASRIARRP